MIGGIITIDGMPLAVTGDGFMRPIGEKRRAIDSGKSRELRSQLRQMLCAWKSERDRLVAELPSSPIKYLAARKANLANAREWIRKLESQLAEIDRLENAR